MILPRSTSFGNAPDPLTAATLAAAEADLHQHLREALLGARLDDAIVHLQHARRLLRLIRDHAPEVSR